MDREEILGFEMGTRVCLCQMNLVRNCEQFSIDSRVMIRIMRST
jgi:hypothetical protein